MEPRQFFENLTRRINELLPQAGRLGDEGRAAMRQLLQKSFSELNIVTQEEFEARDRALKRAEHRVAELERLVKELEERMDGRP